LVLLRYHDVREVKERLIPEKFSFSLEECFNPNYRSDDKVMSYTFVLRENVRNKTAGYSELEGFWRSMKTEDGCLLGCSAVWSESHRPDDGGSKDL
jgi:ribosomal protein S17E